MISSVNNWVRELNLEIDTLLDKENRMWLQRSETLWATQGDRNTHFFHNKATKMYPKKKKKKFIHRIKNPDEQWSSNREEVDDILMQYYQDLLSQPTLHNLKKLCSRLTP